MLNHYSPSEVILTQASSKWERNFEIFLIKSNTHKSGDTYYSKRATTFENPTDKENALPSSRCSGKVDRRMRQSSE